MKLTKAKLEDSERKLVEFAQKENLVNTGENGQSLAIQNLTQLNAALATAQDQRIRAQARWQQASSGAMPADMIGNSNIRTLQSQKAALQGTYQQKLQTFKPDYPEMLPLKSQIDELDRQIAQEIGGVRASVRAEYNAAATQERMLIGQISSLRSQALDVDGRSIQYNILKRETDTNRQIYDSLLQRFKEVGVAGGVRANNISIIDRAQTAWRIKPDPLTNIFLGILLGLLRFWPKLQGADALGALTLSDIPDSKRITCPVRCCWFVFGKRFTTVRNNHETPTRSRSPRGARHGARVCGGRQPGTTTFRPGG